MKRFLYIAFSPLAVVAGLVFAIVFGVLLAVGIEE